MIVSDHGMSMAKDLNYKIFLSDYIDVSGIEVINEGPVVQLNAKTGSQVFFYLKSILKAQHSINY